MTGNVDGRQALAAALTAVAHAYTDPSSARALARGALTAARGRAEVSSVAERALGMASAAVGDLPGGIRHLRRAIRAAEAAELADRDAEARGSLAYVLVLTGRSGEALRQLDRAQDTVTAPRVEARLLMQRGLVLTELRRLDEADNALTRALTTLERAGGDDLLEADIRNNRAIVHLGGEGWPQAREDLRRAEELYERVGHRGRTAMVLHNRGVGESLHGDLPAALAAFDAAAERYRDAGMHGGLLEVDRAEALLSAGLVTEARRAAETAVADFTRRRNAVDLVQARLLLAQAALRDDPATARSNATSARRSAQRQQRAGWAALGGYLRLLAIETSSQGADARLAAATMVAQELDSAGWHVQAMDARLIAARSAIRRGHVEKARFILAEGASARTSGPAALRARAWHATALLRRAEGDVAGAAAAVRAGLGVLDRFRASLGASDLRSHVSGHGDSLARLGVDLALESGRATAVLAAADRLRAGAVWLPPARPPDDRASAEDLARLRRLDSDRRSGAIEPGAGWDRQVALERRVRDRARQAAGAAASPRRAASAAALGRALGRGTLVEFVAVEDDLYAVAVGASGCSLHRLGPIRPVVDSMQALRAAMTWLAHGAGQDGVEPFADLARRHAELLDALTVGPLQLPDDGPLVLVPTGELARMPWSALPSLQARAISVAPSAALWLRAATASAVDSDRVVLAHGPDLPAAPHEVRVIAAAYPHARVLASAEATVPAVLGALEGVSLAHLAAHGRFRVDNPMFSELQFIDGPLTIYDLELLRRPPQTVVLASCDAGLTRVERGDEALGLSSALLAMGTRALVAPVVPVADGPSGALMIDLHRHVSTGSTIAQALAAARADTRARLVGEPADARSLAAMAASWAFACFGAG